MILTSGAFQHTGFIPRLYTCDGANINPPLAIADIPQTAQSLVLIMDDPDVPKYIRPTGIWDHWIIFRRLHSPLTQAKNLMVFAALDRVTT
jgi:phosphatidylethanolamine-binding protein (PEBP) family uncharacterized protein